MTVDHGSPGAAPERPWPVLDVNERRVLGVLIEKAKTTPDAYPMSVNGVVTGSNQKSNRDPILNLSDDEVEDALTRCQKKGLAIRLTGGSRVERWKHNLYEAWTPDKIELAILGELLLRGPQTEGELRGRASRMEPIDDLDHLRALLRPLVERKLVVYLTAADRRGAMLSHGFHEPNELDNLRSRAVAEPVAVAPTAGAAAPATANAETRIRMVETDIGALTRQVTELQTIVRTLQDEVRSLRQSLGD